MSLVDLKISKTIGGRSYVGVKFAHTSTIATRRKGLTIWGLITTGRSHPVVAFFHLALLPNNSRFQTSLELDNFLDNFDEFGIRSGVQGVPLPGIGALKKCDK
jgi:hypothetical protein